MTDKRNLDDLMSMCLVAKDTYFCNLEDKEFSNEMLNIENEDFVRYSYLKRSIGEDSFIWEFIKRIEELDYIEIHNFLMNYDFCESNLILLEIISKNIDIKSLKLIYEGLKGEYIYSEYGSLEEASEDSELFETVSILKKIDSIIDRGEYLELL